MCNLAIVCKKFYSNLLIPTFAKKRNETKHKQITKKLKMKIKKKKKQKTSQEIYCRKIVTT